MLMESRAAWANAPALMAHKTPAAREVKTNLRVTVLASGCDARQFMTGRLRKYFNQACFISQSQNSLLVRGQFRITRTDVRDPRPHARPHLAQFGDPGRPGLPGSHDEAAGRGRLPGREPPLRQRGQFLGDPR